MTTAFRLEGLDELERRLLAVPKKIAGRVLGAAMRAGARELQREIKSRAPVDTGALKRNVVTKRGRASLDHGLAQRQIVGVRHGKARKVASVFKTKGGKTITRKLTAYDRKGEDPFYFKFLELGYHAVGRHKAANRSERRNRKTAAPSYGRFISPRRFIRDGATAAAPRALEAIRARLASELERLS